MLLLFESSSALDPTLIVGLVVFVALAAVSGGVVYLAGRLNRQTEALAPIRRLEAIEGLLRQLTSREDELDLRRLEHVLIDLRDGQKRLEERLLRLLEPGPAPGGALASSGVPAGLGERVATRLIAMGFESIDVITPLEELEELAEGGDGEIVVEARRGGALHKGCVHLRDGAICDVKLRDSYKTFP